MFKKIVYSVALTIVILIGAGPWAIYLIGLCGVEGRPEPPVALASQERQQAVWKLARGTGIPKLESVNPYNYFQVTTGTGTKKSALMVAWWVASDYNISHRRYSGMGWWHLSGAALTIWLCKNWSIEQLLTKAANSEEFKELTAKD